MKNTDATPTWHCMCGEHVHDTWAASAMHFAQHYPLSVAAAALSVALLLVVLAC